ncbi:MAG: hypothetical protein U9N42_04215 [Campylobacterota bacterium]|nr:hypothetical protein [Campylobacterota bacterium]
MKQKIRDKAKKIVESPHTKKAVESIKPDRNIWGFLGVTIFFILPEIIAFIYGVEITQYSREELTQNNSTFMHYYYTFLEMMFENGGSYVSLVIGFALLVWLFF